VEGKWKREQQSTVGSVGNTHTTIRNCVQNISTETVTVGCMTGNQTGGFKSSEMINITRKWNDPKCMHALSGVSVISNLVEVYLRFMIGI